MAATQQFDVIVIGGGILGISAARHLARVHHRSVALVTSGNLLNGASGRSLSWLNSAGPRSLEYHHLRLEGMQRYRALARDSSSQEFLRFDGGFTWAGEGASHQERHRYERSIGYPSRWIGGDEVAGAVAGVDPAAVADEGGILNADEGWVDLPWLGRRLLGEFVEAGGSLRVREGAWAPEAEGGRVRGVHSDAGTTLRAEQVLLATGAGTPGLLQALGTPVPDDTSIAVSVHATPGSAQPLTAVLNTPRIAIRPAPHGGLVMDADWLSDGLVDEGGDEYRLRPDVLGEFVAEARRVLAGHPRLEVTGIGIGPKPIPGDGQPVLGPVPGIEGLSVAFTHSGATLALIAGELLAAEIATSQPAPELGVFRLQRFLGD